MAKPIKLLLPLACIALLGLGILWAAKFFQTPPSQPNPRLPWELVKAGTSGTVFEFAKIIALGADVNAADDHGYTILMLVALDETGSGADKARVLLQAKADPGKKNSSGETALHMAAEAADPALVKVLLEAGADVNAVTAAGLTALNLACVKNQKWEKGRQEEVVRLLLEAGADINSGLFSLGLAAAGAESATIKLLIEAGSEVNQADEQGRTPLMNAMDFNSDPEVAILLLNAAVDVNLRDNQIRQASNATDSRYRTEVDRLAQIKQLPQMKGLGTAPSLHQAMALDPSRRLQSLMERFVNCGDISEAKGLVWDIIFAWTGVTDEDPNSRGGNIGDARKLLANEKLHGQRFYSHYWGANPGPAESRSFQENFSKWEKEFTSYLMLSTHYRRLFRMAVMASGELEAGAGPEALAELMAELKTIYSGGQESDRVFIADFLFQLGAYDSRGQKCVQAIQDFYVPIAFDEFSRYIASLYADRA